MQKRTLLKAMAAGLVALPAAAFAADAAPAAAGASPLPPPGPGCGCPPPPPPPCGCPGRQGPHGAFGPQGHGRPGPHPGHRADPWAASPEEAEKIAAHVSEQLKITPEQKPAFDAWVSAKREAAASRGKLRDEILAAKDGQARAELHLKAVRERGDQLEKVVKARGRLVEVLSPEQKALFERFENGHGPRGFHGPHGLKPGMPAPKP